MIKKLIIIFYIFSFYGLFAAQVAMACESDHSGILLPIIPADILVIDPKDKLPLPNVGSKFKVVSPLYDIKFKKIFGTTDLSEECVMAFLNDIWGFTGGKKINEISFLPVARYRDDKIARTCFFDILCIDKGKQSYIIEMQKAPHTGFFKRMFYYSSVELVRQEGDLWRGDVGSARLKRFPGKVTVAPSTPKSYIFYSGLLPVKTLVIANFVLFKDRPKDYLHFADIVFRKDPRDICSNIFTWCFIELAKFKPSKVESNIEKWLTFLRSGESVTLDPSLINGNREEILRKAYAMIKFITPKEKVLLERAQEAMRDSQVVLDYKFKEGKAEGKAEGVDQSVIARTMLKEDISIEEIMGKTDLTEIQIDKLKLELQVERTSAQRTLQAQLQRQKAESDAQVQAELQRQKAESDARVQTELQRQKLESVRKLLLKGIPPAIVADSLELPLEVVMSIFIKPS